MKTTQSVWCFDLVQKGQPQHAGRCSILAGSLRKTSTSPVEEVPSYPQGMNSDKGLMYFTESQKQHLLAVSKCKCDALKPITADKIQIGQERDQFYQSVHKCFYRGEKLLFAHSDKWKLFRSSSEKKQFAGDRVLGNASHTSATVPKRPHTPEFVKSTSFFRRSFYWMDMVINCYTTINNPTHCALNRMALRRQRKPIKYFPARRPLIFMTINLLGLLIRILQ